MTWKGIKRKKIECKSQVNLTNKNLTLYSNSTQLKLLRMFKTDISWSDFPEKTVTDRKKHLTSEKQNIRKITRTFVSLSSSCNLNGAKTKVKRRVWRFGKAYRLPGSHTCEAQCKKCCSKCSKNPTYPVTPSWEENCQIRKTLYYWRGRRSNFFCQLDRSSAKTKWKGYLPGKRNCECKRFLMPKVKAVPAVLNSAFFFSKTGLKKKERKKETILLWLTLRVFKEYFFWNIDKVYYIKYWAL